MLTTSIRRSLMAGAALLTLGMAAPALAQSNPTTQANARPYDLKAQDLGQALADVAQQSGREVIAPGSLVAGKTAPALKGRFTPNQAFDRLLMGSGLVLTPVGDRLVLRPANGVTPGEPQPAAADSLSEIVVTGTRIRGAAPVGSNLIAISRQDIEASGYATTQQILQALPQNYGGGANEATLSLSNRGNAGRNTGFGSGINLRGLGNSSTLVLLNGVRPAMGGISGTFADVSLIPSTAIDHVEVLADGASALYGSDAVAGVVNITFRDRFEGAETRLRYGAGRGFDEVQASQILGHRWGDGQVVLAYEYAQRGRLAADDRDYIREDLRPFGGGDYRSNYAAPGTVIAGGQYFALPAGQNGVGLTPAQLTPGQINRRDIRLGSDVLPRQRVQSLYLSANQDLGPDTTLSGQLLVADRRFDLRMPRLNYGTSVPVDNPFHVDPIGTHDPLYVLYDFGGDLGALTLLGHVRAYNGSVQATHRWGRWSATLDGGYGEQREYSRYANDLNFYRLDLALADTNPATAYNVMGQAGSTNRGTIDAVRGFSANTGLYRVWTAGLRGDGPILDLPAGPIQLALGAEWRAERFQYASLDDRFDAAPVTSRPAYPGTRKIAAAYAELRVPLVGEAMQVAAIHSLTLSLAGRVEHYSDFGSTSNPKIGLDWSPLEGLTVRGSYGTSFRAPAFSDQRIGPGYVIIQPLPLSDPQSPTGSTNIVALAGNAEGIGPERANTWTLGLDLQPPAVSGLRLQASYFRVDYRDRIGSINADLLNALVNRATYAPLIEEPASAARLTQLYASPYFSNPYNIPAASIGAIVDSRITNLAAVVEDGVDFDVGYKTRLADVSLDLGVSGTYILDLDQSVTKAAPKVDVLGTVGNPVDLRLRGRLMATRGPWDAAAFINFTNHYQNQTVSPARAIASWTTIDLQIGYRFGDGAGRLKGVRAAITASNLLDTDPPFAELRVGTSAVGYDSDNASPVGRVVAFQVTKAW
jgi:iron complex outermembrane receptor protein